MSLNLSFGPRRRRSWRSVWLAVAALLLVGAVSWQRGWLPTEARANLEQNLREYAPALTRTQPTEPAAKPAAEAEAVVLVSSQVVEQPHSSAFTADLYQNTTEDHHIPWPNVAGRTEIRTYTVQSGDTLWGIAAQFGLDIDTLRWSNPELERNPDVLPVGVELVIPPVQGAYYTVGPGDTLSSIADQYGVAVADIVNYPPNRLTPPYTLEPGRGLIVPYGRKDLDIPPPDPVPDSQLAWPVVGIVTDTFDQSHKAVDIAAPYGSTVYAAAEGRVNYVSWIQTGYGYTIIIDHEDGFRTLYSHLKGASVQAGDWVARGDPIGAVGSTGRSTGPHIHFEVRQANQHVDPLDYLPAGDPH